MVIARIEKIDREVCLIKVAQDNIYCYSPGGKMQIQRKGLYLSGTRLRKALAACVAVASLGSIAGYSQSNDVIYEGARLIIGDSIAPIESGAFVVQNGRITAIGLNGSIKAPAGTARVPI